MLIGLWTAGVGLGRVEISRPCRTALRRAHSATERHAGPFPLRLPRVSAEQLAAA